MFMYFIKRIELHALRVYFWSTNLSILATTRHLIRDGMVQINTMQGGMLFSFIKTAKLLLIQP